MGFFFKARGNISTGLLLIRLSLGFMFLLSGSAKIVNLESYISNVKALGILNENLSFITGFLLPFVEVVFGSLFIIGLFTPLTSFVLSMLVISYLLLFGAGSESLPYSHFIIFLACTLTTLFAGAGVISFDALLDKAKKKERREIIVTQTETVTKAVEEQPVKSYEIKEEEKVDVRFPEENPSEEK